jgi:signal-transduction protein with cAMP-binding, CBS, and nucleotidyltransferase domain
MKNPFQRSYSAEELSIFNFLSGVKLFEQLNHEEKAFFLPYLYLRKYQRDEVVYFRRDPSHALYIIKKGKISIMLEQAGEMETLNKIGAGNSFGNNALIKNTSRLTSALVSSKDAELYVLPNVNIQDIFESRPRIKARMLESLAELYDEYNKSLFASYKSSQGFFSLDLLFTTF